MSTPESESPHKAGRANQVGASIVTAKIAGNLALASSITIALLVGIVFSLVTATIFIVNSPNPILGFGVAVIVTVLVNAIIFFVSPWIMDLTQGWLYHTRWVNLAEIERLSPESARTIQRVCNLKKITQPRLGIIDDNNPTAFTYGALPNSARLVVSAGLFKYLDDDEAATVYAHELGHIVHWDFAVMTVASTLVQITYLLYVTIREVGKKINDERAENAAMITAFIAYGFYIVGTYLLLYLSRTREYFADHFAAEQTGNPNALSRALVKIAYGIVQETEKSKEPSRLMQGTRALGIYDAKAAASTGTVYQISSSPEKIGRLFLWDLFNPWGWWMELNSTHPLTGKRVRALSNYAEQLGLDMEFDMGRVVAEGNHLDQKRLYGTFYQDVLLYGAEFIAIILGLAIGAVLFNSIGGLKAFVAIPLLLLGAVMLFKRSVMYPSSKNAPATDVITLMSDAYASPLRGQPVQLEGTLIGRGDAGYVFGSDLKLQDKSGLMYLLYASRWGPFGNFFFGMKRVQGLIGMETTAKGWFRRGIASWMDLELLSTANGNKVSSHPAFWGLIWSIIFLAIGALLFLAK
ncbi:MAG: zinc metalloprotease HtpX [Pseudanabaena sp.]|jgi:Zn-dependent protease with chaperone function|uniref:zinc metalloprotease HtpX n=1 Tax=Pseudanabaena mucicola TaxID=71190 RepID=UPI00257843D4|nr:zinc metalloprotease HtpX [Pseudanabaena mucicola]MCA6573855.1 M48 family metalloprotease [Pseudanabaena sp. M53BS1SP1A06MG]MCA6584364.1 M48 family metalloprotease [Pseudanabaena sp. M34BS1SP1A06MG]MCA6588432.1 M48 family metalloprotease [Pseudanabaena sp. M109S1SP1A06QC]MCA6592616.1 M48 family metalloprotease [Pseudanabaena sp. M38BS1SP1A06MG]MCA6595855.1 M48 family metalloprotease [Pseudanabaena sp. M046S1SP1A06QC]MCA6598680.1 M48 family metalloprotease [Pseudanabaena sp. M57BS1SP1A06MG]